MVLREKRRLRVIENRVLRRIFRPKRNKVTGGWGKLLNSKLYDFYAPQIINRAIKSRRMK
jgi:hypothetical protein